MQANDSFRVVGHLDAQQLVNPKKLKRVGILKLGEQVLVKSRCTKGKPKQGLQYNTSAKKLELVTPCYGMIGVPQLETELTLLYSRKISDMQKPALDSTSLFFHNNLEESVHRGDLLTGNITDNSPCFS